jgi:hypothetical protein
VIRLYIFCSKVEKYLWDSLTSELQEWNTLVERTVKNLSWHSPTRKRRRTGAGSTVHSGNGDRGGNDGPADADVFDDDRLMEVMKWRNEVVEDGKEAWTIPGEGEIPGMTWLQFEGRFLTSRCVVTRLTRSLLHKLSTCRWR